TDNGGPLAPGHAAIAGEPHGRRPLRRAARTSVCHEFLVDQGLHATAGLYVRLLCEVGCRLLRGAGVHGRSCSARRRALPFGGLCLRLCSPLSRRPFRRCARAGSAHHAFWRLPGQGLCLEVDSGRRRDDQYGSHQLGNNTTAIDLVDLQPGCSGGDTPAFPVAVCLPPGLRRIAKRPHRDNRSGPRSGCIAQPDPVPGDTSAVPCRARFGLRLCLPDLCGGLRNASVPRRPIKHNARPVHCDRVLDAVQLVRRRCNVVRTSGRLPDDPGRSVAHPVSTEKLMRARVAAWVFVIGPILVFMLGPMVLVVIFSFSANPLISFPVRGLTFDWYRALFHNREFWNALQNSLIVAGAVGAISTFTGTMAAFGLMRLGIRLKGPVLTWLSLPVMLPPLLLAVALVVFYVRMLQLPLTLATVIGGHVLITQPFVIFILLAPIAHFRHTSLAAPRGPPANRWHAFMSGTLP